MDRTNWKFGKRDMNILVCGVVYKGVAFPIIWKILNKKGCSSTKERIELIEELLEVVGRNKISSLVCDREFVGKAWFKYLTETAKLSFHIRIKMNTQVEIRGKLKAIKLLFLDLPFGKVRVLRKRRNILGVNLQISGMKLSSGEFLIVASNLRSRNSLAVYRKRWSIETLFSCLKKRGFNFEDTHMTSPERIKKLMGLLSIAFIWSHLVGEWINETKELRIKNHSYKEKSFFRAGLDLLQQILLNFNTLRNEFYFCIRILNENRTPVLVT